jgi:hypothetical protein
VTVSRGAPDVVIVWYYYEGRLQRMALIYTNPHQQGLLAVQQELQQRLQQREWIERRIVELQEAIQTLTPLAQNEFENAVSLSLPQLCLRVLSFTPNHGVSAPAVRDGLKMMGVDISAKNPLGVLHTTLGRLVQSGYAVPVPTQPGTTTHFQITPAGTLYLQQVF